MKITLYKINESLATHGLGEIGYPLSKDKLETGRLLEDTDFTILDCRDLMDEPNDLETYRTKLIEASGLLQKHKKIVICCGAGMSRSPAIAIGVLTKEFKMDFFDAYNLVHEKVPIAEIEPCHISSLKKIFKVKLP